MKYEIELDGRFVVDINFFTNSSELFYEDMTLPKSEKKGNSFLLGNEEIRIAGTLFSGIYLVRGEKKALLTKLFWYDYIACILPFVVGLLGKILGAVLGAACFYVCYKTMPYIKNYFLRLLLCIGVAGVLLVLIVTLAHFFPALFFLKGDENA